MLYQAWSTDPVAMWNNVECDQQEYEINQRTVHAERPPTHFRQYNKNLLVRAQWYTMIVCSTLYTVQFRLSNSHFPTHQINGLNRAGADWSVHSCRRRWSEAVGRVGPAIPIWKVLNTSVTYASTKLTHFLRSARDHAPMAWRRASKRPRRKYAIGKAKRNASNPCYSVANRASPNSRRGKRNFRSLYKTEPPFRSTSSSHFSLTQFLEPYEFTRVLMKLTSQNMPIQDCCA